MSMVLETFVHRNPSDMTMSVGATFDSLAIYQLGSAILSEVARSIAERYVSEHYQEIVAKISQEAIASLVVAESAAVIAETLKEKIPDKVLEVVHREVYQRGVFGGMTRIR